MSYAPLLPALICVLLAAALAVGSIWLARRARSMRLEERERYAAELEAEGPQPSGANDLTLFVRFERAGEDIMRGVLRRYAPDGTLPAEELRAAVEPMVDSLRLATHAEAVELPTEGLPEGVAAGATSAPPAAASETQPVKSPVEGGLVTYLRVTSRAPLPGLSDPTHRASLASFLRALASFDPTTLLSVKLAEAVRQEGAPRELRPLHR